VERAIRRSYVSARSGWSPRYAEYARPTKMTRPATEVNFTLSMPRTTFVLCGPLMFHVSEMYMLQRIQESGCNHTAARTLQDGTDRPETFAYDILLWFRGLQLCPNSRDLRHKFLALLERKIQCRRSLLYLIKETVDACEINPSGSCLMCSRATSLDGRSKDAALDVNRCARWCRCIRRCWSVDAKPRAERFELLNLRFYDPTHIIAHTVRIAAATPPSLKSVLVGNLIC
jgi:hypothetical protein